MNGISKQRLIVAFVGMSFLFLGSSFWMKSCADNQAKRAAMVPSSTATEAVVK